MKFLAASTLFASISFVAAVQQDVDIREELPAVEKRDCADVHLFLARGNEEGYPGRIGALAQTACAGLDSCDYENIMFTSVDGSVYCDSIYQGAVNGLSQIAAYNKACPKAKLVLGGYSEGAHVVGAILGGGGGAFYNCVENGVTGLDPYTAPGNMIVAAALFGDVRHIASQSYNVGTGSPDEGEYPRSGSQLAALNLYSARLQNYCLATDPICALGDDGISHTTYMTVFAAQAGAWVQSMVANPIAVDGNTVSSSSSSVVYSSTSSSLISSTSVSSTASTSSTSSTKSTSSTITSSRITSTSSTSSPTSTTTYAFILTSLDAVSTFPTTTETPFSAAVSSTFTTTSTSTTPTSVAPSATNTATHSSAASHTWITSAVVGPIAGLALVILPWLTS